MKCIYLPFGVNRKYMHHIIFMLSKLQKPTRNSSFLIQNKNKIWPNKPISFYYPHRLKKTLLNSTQTLNNPSKFKSTNYLAWYSKFIISLLHVRDLGSYVTGEHNIVICLETVAVWIKICNLKCLYLCCFWISKLYLDF